MHTIRKRSGSKTIQNPICVAVCVANADGLRGSLVIILLRELRESLAEDSVYTNVMKKLFFYVIIC